MVEVDQSTGLHCEGVTSPNKTAQRGTQDCKQFLLCAACQQACDALKNDAAYCAFVNVLLAEAIHVS